MISLTADQLDQIIGGGLRRYGISPRIVLRTASVEAVRSLVASPRHQGAHPRHRHRSGVAARLAP